DVYKRQEYEGKEGGAYEEMRDSIGEYLRAQKASDKFEEFAKGLMERAKVVKNKRWVLAERRKEIDLIEEAKKKRLPIIADFGRGVCIPCKKMMPILEELKRELKGRADVLVIDTAEHPTLVRKYNIVSIPTQIFFDGSGKEVFRHIGFFSKEEILRTLEEVESGRLSPMNGGSGSYRSGLFVKAENMLKEGSWLAVILVFFLGLLTASNPCVIAAIPLVIGYIGGYKEASGLKRSFLFSLFFILGLAVMFMALGIIAAFTGSMVGDVGSFWAYVVAGVCILVGLHLLNVLEFNIPVPRGLTLKYRGILGSFLFGLLFGIISTPCSIPIVAVLMVLIAAKGSVIYGAVMLLVYSLGHSVLILVAGTSIGAAKGIIESKGLTKVTNALRKVAAVLIICVGFWFLFR
ncbi:MAG: sulfite exporter TauE/SafE family protein, partial [Planctomycetota bacterium]|nr:sulfite exporter TauE/SafE family protein [Planctomycetota bacterium]